VATELGDIKILIDVDVTRFEASLNNAMARATSAFNRMGAGMSSSINQTLSAGFRAQYQAFSTGLQDTFRNAFAAAEREQAQSMARLQSRMRQSMGSTSSMTQVGQSVGSSFAIGFSSPILNAVSAIHSAMYGLKDIGQMVGTVTGFTMAANLGGIQSGISALMKDTRQGAQIAGQLQQLAMETPFGVEDFSGIGRKMLAMGTPGNQLIPQLTTLADAVAATGGGASELRDIAEFIAKIRMNPRAIDSDTLLGLVRSGMPLRQTAERMAGRRFENEQEATMFLQSRISGRGSRGVAEINAALQAEFGGSSRALGRTDMASVTQRVSESAQSMLMGTSGKGLNVALGGLNLLSDVMGTIGKLNTATLGIPGMILLVSTFGYLKNAFITAKSGLDAFIASLNSFTSSIQVAQARGMASATMGSAASIPMYLSSYAQMSGQMNPAFLAANQYVNGKWVPIPPPAPLTPMQKVSAGIQGRMTAMNAGINNYMTNNPNAIGNIMSGVLMFGGVLASQSLANQQANLIGNEKAMAQSTRLQNTLGGAASGAMIGNLIGSAVPVIGNVVGTIAGTLIGGAAAYLTSEDPSKLPSKAIDENTKALNNATVAMTLLASSIIGGGPRASGAVSAIELEMYMASRNNMMNVGIG
jgi:hypothetical protein